MYAVGGEYDEWAESGKIAGAEGVRQSGAGVRVIEMKMSFSTSRPSLRLTWDQKPGALWLKRA